MHELAITESILEITLRHADQARATRVTDIHLVLGELASIVDDSVQFYWDMISEDTLAEGATLHFRRIAALMECQDCGARYKPGDGQLLLPRDGSQKAGADVPAGSGVVRVPPRQRIPEGRVLQETGRYRAADRGRRSCPFVRFPSARLTETADSRKRDRSRKPSEAALPLRDTAAV